ncbi:MAG: phage holin [Lachnospiraceae bacterium]|nr:phage holin [Lachnospiraceae bacterium]
MMFSNEQYDKVKFVAQIVLPAAGTLYFALASIWGLPYGEQIVGTITAIDAFLGAVLKISTDQYKKEMEEGTRG